MVLVHLHVQLQSIASNWCRSVGMRVITAFWLLNQSY